MGAALQYLSLVPGDVAPDIAVLRDRIHRSGAPDVYAAPEPMFPFIAEDVPVDPSAAQQAAQQYSQQQAAFSLQPAQTGGSVMGQGFARKPLFPPLKMKICHSNPHSPSCVFFHSGLGALSDARPGRDHAACGEVGLLRRLHKRLCMHAMIAFISML